MPDLLYIAALSAGAFVTLFVLSKIMGNREMSQLSMFDYINSITIGSIAAEMATSLSDNFMEPLVAMFVFALLSVLMALITSKSIKARRALTGRPAILFENGQIYRKNLDRHRLDINEFLTQCRINGYFDLSEIHTAILESNGKISFLPAVGTRPATPEDMNLMPQQKTTVANVIIDGHIMHKNLQHTGNDENWLNEQLLALGAGDLSGIFLATCDCNNKLSVYKRIDEKVERDILG